MKLPESVIAEIQQLIFAFEDEYQAVPEVVRLTREAEASLGRATAAYLGDVLFTELITSGTRSAFSTVYGLQAEWGAATMAVGDSQGQWMPAHGQRPAAPQAKLHKAAAAIPAGSPALPRGGLDLSDDPANPALCSCQDDLSAAAAALRRAGLAHHGLRFLRAGLADLVGQHERQASALTEFCRPEAEASLRIIASEVSRLREVLASLPLPQD